MPTTTNYGWTTPADTDLVKDGASAIRTLGTAIDTTVFNNASAAIAKTIVDAKGDIIAATAADTVARLAVGANDTVLTADSSTATGLKWAAPASGGMTLISTTSITGTSTTLSSIPQTYTNLQLIIFGLTWDTTNGLPSIKFNGSATPGASYSGTRGGGFISRGNAELWWTNANWTRTDANNVVVFNFYDYTNATRRKVFDYAGANEEANYRGYEAGGIWHGTDAITSLTISVEGYSFTAGTALLYGVK